MSFRLAYREQERYHARKDGEDLFLDENLKQAFDYDYTASLCQHRPCPGLLQ